MRQATFQDVAEVAERCAGEGGRLKKRAWIAEALGRVAGADAAGAGDGAGLADAGRFAMYLAGEPFAEADGRKLNAGGALLSRAVLTVSGANEAMLTAAYRRHGDLGAAAFDLLVAQGSAAAGGGLPTVEVAATFAAMAAARTTAVRAGLVEDLLRRASPLEAKYLLKLMLGDMRIGVKQALIEEAIAVAATAAGGAAEAAAVRHAVMLEADLGRAVERAFRGTLAAAAMTLFHPLGFMLASPVDSPEEAVARFTEKPAPVKKVRGKKGKLVEGKLAEMGAGGTGAAQDQAQQDQAQQDQAQQDQAQQDQAQQDQAQQDQAQQHQAHAAWHVVQQDEGRGGPTESGAADGRGAVEDAEGLEREADRMGAAAAVAATAAATTATAAPMLAFLEDKYDGMRAQVHCGDGAQPGRVAIYSRNREDITQSFPELAEAFAHVTEPLILDGEILGWELAGEGRALPFAVMGQRIGRKVVSDALRREIPVVFMGFDLLYAQGELLLPLPLWERRARLEEVFARYEGVTVAGFAKAAEPVAQATLFAAPGGAVANAGRADAPRRWLLSPSQRVADAEAIDRAYTDARARKNEGVMLKAAGSAYLPGRRGLAWVKLKRELGSLDVVITGAEFGSGRRAALLSDYTFAVRGEVGELLNVGKAYSGVTDVEILWLTEWLKAHTLEDRGHFRTVEPMIVLEVTFNNVMRSTRHASGFALRFPRIVRIREDKPLDEIDTLARVEEIYQSQPDRPEEQGAQQ